MSTVDYWYNILGCLTRHGDLNGVRAWLARARGESATEQMWLVRQVHDWILKSCDRDDLVEPLFGLLAEVDPAGDAFRRIEYGNKLREIETDLQRRLAEEQANAARTREEAERRELAERERQETDRRRRETESELNRVLGGLQAHLRDSYLDSERYFQQFCAGVIPRARFEQELAAFAKEWVIRNVCGRSQNRVLPPDDQQAAAIASVFGNVQVVARAGSGKTSTLVSRAAFLVQHCGVAPTELLLLAFNKAAAAEMSGRLKAIGIPCPHVLTFHALAYRLVHPDQDLIYDDDASRNSAHTRVLQNVINQILDQREWHDRVRTLMLEHYRADWDALIEKGLGQSRTEGLAFRRALVNETLRGEYVKSRGEQLIANFLFEHDIAYLYERNHWWKGRNYRPDFTLEGRKVVIEYFGLAGDANYDEQIQEKRDYWATKPDWCFLEYGSEYVRDLGAEGLHLRLRKDLEALGVPMRRLSEEEIWDRIRERTLTRLAATLRTFVGRCRKAGLSVSGLAERMRQYSPSDALESRFLEIAVHVFESYLNRLSEEGLEDFDGLMQRAAEMIENGVTVFDGKSGRGDLARLRFVMVDEFQDMSSLFIRLLKGIEHRNSDVQFFGVGDDWQAINAFAGSDLRYFGGFGEMFSPAKRMTIATNYRSAGRIVELGNRIMLNRGEPARPRADAASGKVVVADLVEFCPSVEERSAWPGDQITPAVRRLLRVPVKSGKSVALLARRNGVPYFVSREADRARQELGLDGLHHRWTRGFAESERKGVFISTAHGYKGGEEDVVIVLDAIDRSFPLIHPDWVFTRVFGDTVSKLIDDERRLFYVACTRARETLILLTESGRESEFLRQIRTMCDSVDWTSYPPFVQATGEWIVKAGSSTGKGSAPTFERKELLKAHGFVFAEDDWKHWWIKQPRSSTLQDIIMRVQQAPWLNGPDGLEVRICTSDGTVVKTFTVIKGRIMEQHNGARGRRVPGHGSMG